jgi:hypothetical protein
LDQSGEPQIEVTHTLAPQTSITINFEIDRPVAQFMPIGETEGHIEFNGNSRIPVAVEVISNFPPSADILHTGLAALRLDTSDLKGSVAVGDNELNFFHYDNKLASRAENEARHGSWRISGAVGDKSVWFDMQLPETKEIALSFQQPATKVIDVYQLAEGEALDHQNLDALQQ